MHSSVNFEKYFLNDAVTDYPHFFPFISTAGSQNYMHSIGSLREDKATVYIICPPTTSKCLFPEVSMTWSMSLTGF